MNLPSWLKPLGVVVAVLMVSILLAGVLGVPFRSMLSPHGYDQPRIHWNTKNSTRFVGDDVSQVAARVSRAVYPAVDDATRPDVVLLYEPGDWQGGLAAAALLRPVIEGAKMRLWDRPLWLQGLVATASGVGFGDEEVVSEETARELAQYGHVTRMPRSDLPEISAYFAGFHDTGADWGAWVLQGARSFGWGIAEAGHNAIFVNLDGPAGWQNVIPATTLSHMGKHAPVLFVNQDGVPDAVASYLEILRPYATAPQQQLLNHGLIIGGEETISWETQVDLDLLLEGQWDAALER